MQTITSKSVATSLAFFLFSGIVAADTWVVDGGGGGDFATIQTAIDAAVDGDVILVRANTYAGFTITGKGLAVFAEPGTQLLGPNGDVRIEQVPLDSTVVLSRIQGDALRIVNNFGTVRVQRMIFGPATIQNSAEVVISKSAFLGTHGEYYTPLPGGPALTISASSVWSYSSNFVGGQGDYIRCFFYCMDSDGTNGGDGVVVQSGTLRASHCSLRGGNGGLLGIHGPDGDGGDGLSNQGAATLRQSVLQGGYTEYAVLGVPWSGVAPTFLDGVGRGLATPHLTAPLESLELNVLGEPGEQAYLILSDRPNALVLPDPEEGTLHLGLPYPGAKNLLGAVPAGQILGGTLITPKVDLGQAQVFFIQAAFVTPLNEIRLGETRAIAVIDPALGF